MRLPGGMTAVAVSLSTVSVHDHLVVALLAGGPDDAEVVDVALAACARGGSDLRVVYVCGAPDRSPTPLAVDYALSYTSGAMRVVRLVPGVHATVVCLPTQNDDAFRRELVRAELLVAPADRAAELSAGDLPEAGPGCRVTIVRGAADAAGHLRFGYRLALLRELETGQCRPDGSTTPEELNDAWHVGVAHPQLRSETIDAWDACSAWPPPTLS